MTLGRVSRAMRSIFPVIVLGHRLWRRRFGADPAIAGKSIALSGRPFTVVGVAPPSFHGFELILDSEFWVPARQHRSAGRPRTGNFKSRAYFLACGGRPSEARRHARTGRSRARRVRAASGQGLPGHGEGSRLPVGASRRAAAPRFKSTVMTFSSAR